MTLNRQTLGLLCCALLGAGCSSGGPGLPDAAGVPTVPALPLSFPSSVPAEVADAPTTPSAEDGTAFGGPSAPLMEGVEVVLNRDSVVVVPPVVANAGDYRVFRLPAGAAVSTVGEGEQVSGTRLFCAGFRQHNDKWTGTRELLRDIEVTGLEGPTTLVVEAIDRACPFPGLLASVHRDLQISATDIPVEERVPFSFFTAAEQRARYGSEIINGQGPGPTLGAPAAPTTPRVLARTTIRVTPSGRAAPRTGTFFDDFEGGAGPLQPAGAADAASRAPGPGRRFVNAKWNFFVYGDEEAAADLSIAHGRLHVTLPDWHQDVFSSVVGVPRRPARLSDSSYLHVTFEVASNATARRYWWFGLCGAPQPGLTFDAQLNFTGRLVQTPFFFQPDGYNVSVEGWNCLQLFPRDGTPFGLPPDDRRSESDVRVMVNKPGQLGRSSVVNVSPPQYPEQLARPSWFRQQDAAGAPGVGLLDDQLLIAPRTRFDLWVRRDRVVLYVNGEQRLCNDFPNQRLTMAEGAVAVGQVLYHSSAERLEFSRDYNDRTGQRHYLFNSPYADQRDWDNVGFEELVGAPASFVESKCYVSPN